MLLSSFLAGHHSFASEYDRNKPVTVAGVVTKIEWQNPHIWIYVDSLDSKGTITHWAISGGGPGQLMRRGITKTVIRQGMTVRVDGFRAKDGSNNVNGVKVQLPDGRSLFTSTDEMSAWLNTQSAKPKN